MDQRWIVIYLLTACVHMSHQISAPNSETYLAAVVEYSPKYIANDSKLTLQENSNGYIKHIKTACEKGADIIVFPEMGLTTVKLPEREKLENWTTIIPAVSDNYVPCNQTTIPVSETLKKISCAAKEYNIYVVINIAEKLPCTGNACPSDKMFYYNSNVVFDRKGKIIARYRKTNLFNEEQFNVTSVPEIVTFDTDFGVKFGTFICFDILFHEPALQLTRLHNITDIVYTTAWFSEVPFLTAVQTQAGWSYAEDVNFLASGYNRPSFGNSGSGIYLGRKGIGRAILPQTTHEEVLIFNVPKIKARTRLEYHSHSDHDNTTWPYNHGKEHVHDKLRRKRENTVAADNEIFLKHDKIQNFETFPLKGNTTKTVCQNNFCCEFQVEIAEMDPNARYRLVTFSGIRKYDTVDAGVRACGVIQCSNDSVSSCGSNQRSGMIFTKIEITATFDDYKDILVMPSTLKSNLLPFTEGWSYLEHSHDEHVHVGMSLNCAINNLVTFGIYSRFFETNDASVAASFNIVIYLVALLTALLLPRLAKDNL